MNTDKYKGMTPEEIEKNKAYNRGCGHFKRRFSKQISEKGLAWALVHIKYISDNPNVEIYKNIKQEDAVIIANECISEYKSTLVPGYSATGQMKIE